MLVPADLMYFDGHFPECPLLPGVVQLNWAVEYGRRHFEIGGDFLAVSGLKFRRVIQPGDAVVLDLEFDAVSSRLHFEYRKDDDICSGGTVAFAGAT